MKSISPIYILLSFLIVASACSYSKKETQALKNGFYYYELEVHPSETDLEFNISLSYLSDSTHQVNLPKDYYGTPQIDKWVTSFKGTNGTQVKEDESNSKLVTPNKNNEVHLNYTIKYDPGEIDKYSYAPKVAPGYFYMAGCQWILPTDPIDSVYNYKIRMTSTTPGWSFYTSLSENSDEIIANSSFEDMIYAGFGGSSESELKNTLKINNSKIAVYINGDFNFDKRGFLDSLNQIIKGQNTFFNEDNQSFYNITIMPRTGLLAGASVPNLFYCFVDPKYQGIELYRLISHEYFHNWLPNKFYLITPEGEHEFKREWFSEGFTEYFSRVFLLESKLISEEYFVDLFNMDIINIRNNPSANESYSEIANRDVFGGAQKKLSYYRGSLIALRWDQQLKAKGSSLKKMIAYLFEKSKASNGELTDSDLYEFGEKYGLNFKQDIDRYIIEGQEIDLLTDAFSGYQLQKDKIRLFYPGYDVTQSGREKVIQGVDINGPAYKAGLRDGMEYVRRKNSNRWSNSWSAKEPFTVFVKVDGTEKQIDFFPEGEEKLVYLYGKAD